MQKYLNILPEANILTKPSTLSKLNISKDLHPSADSLPLITNYVLSNLKKDDLARLLPDLKAVYLNFGEVIYRVEDSIRYVYFPESAVISVIATTAEGKGAEVGMIGGEGIIGVDGLLGANKMLNEHLVSIAGSAFKVKISVIREELKKSGAFQSAAFNFIRLLMLQTSQIALCNRLHQLEARLAKWLLLCDGRALGQKLNFTQDFLAMILAVNRPSLTSAALILKNAGLIEYRRGTVTILDRRGLEYITCECYRKVKNEYDQLEKHLQADFCLSAGSLR